MKGFPITVNIYAENEAEVADARSAIIEFIDKHGREGRAVTAKKIAQAVRSCDDNVFVRNRIIDYLSK